jgi:hypothetical protein
MLKWIKERKTLALAHQRQFPSSMLKWTWTRRMEILLTATHLKLPHLWTSCMLKWIKERKTLALTHKRQYAQVDVDKRDGNTAHRHIPEAVAPVDQLYAQVDKRKKNTPEVAKPSMLKWTRRRVWGNRGFSSTNTSNFLKLSYCY